MTQYEYKVVPAPRRGEKAKGLKTTEERFALALTQLMNRLGAEGWDYVRADTLPVDERVGFTGTKTSYQNLLVFRRVLAQPQSAPVPPLTASSAPEGEAPRLGPAAEVEPGKAPSLGPADRPIAAE